MERLAHAGDFSFIYNLYMHPAVNPWLLYEQMDPADFEPIFNELINKKALFIFEQGETAVGMFKLVPQKYRNSHIVYLGGVAIDPAYAGKGYGETMLRRLLAIAAEKGFTRVELTVAVENRRAIQLYEKVGFINEGVLKNYSFLAAQNRYIDEQVMAKLA
jgi:RimJ/RimL family protein N-acetyltransferase